MKKSIKAGVLLLIIGFTVVLLSAALMSFYSFEAHPISGTQAWAKGEWVWMPPKGNFIKIVNTTIGNTVGGSYHSSERLHVYVFDEENFLKFISGSPNYTPLSSTQYSLAACYYVTSLKDGPLYIVLHNPTDRVTFLHSCCHVFDTKSILIPKSENYFYRLILLFGVLLSAFGLGIIILVKIYEKRSISPAQ